MVWEPWHGEGCYGYWHSTSQVLESGKRNVAAAFKVMTLAMLLLFLLKVVNCHFSPKIGSFGEVLCGI